MRVRRCFFWPGLLIIGLTIVSGRPICAHAEDSGARLTADDIAEVRGSHSRKAGVAAVQPVENASRTAAQPAENVAVVGESHVANSSVSVDVEAVEAPGAAVTGADEAPASIEDKTFPSRPGSTVPTQTPSTDRKSLRSSGSSWPMWAAMTVVLALIAVAVFVLRKACPGMRAFGGLPMVQVLGRTYLSPKQTLAMVKIDRQVILLGLTEHTISTLLTVSDPDDVSRLLAALPTRSSQGVASAFSSLFHREQQHYPSDADLSGDALSADPMALSDAEPERSAVGDLRQQLNSLIGKVERLKGMGGPKE